LPSDQHNPPQDASPPGSAGRSLPVIEEPLDAGNQSLADALRLSFRVLKVIMVFAVIVFLGSGFYTVDQNEKVVLTRFGAFKAVEDPGLHFSFPKPIDARIRVKLDTRTLVIKTFWMHEEPGEATIPLSQRMAGRASLVPGVDGALLTAVETRDASGRAVPGEGAELVHVKWTIAYRVVDPEEFVHNVVDAERIVQRAIEGASVASAARFTMDDIAFFNQTAYRVAVQDAAQESLDALHSGIKLDNVDNVPYQPLQIKREFDAVIQAENRKRQTIQAAEQKRRRILNEAAGEAYPTIVAAIQDYGKLSRQQRDSAAAQQREADVENLLLTVARGRSSEIIQQARAESDQIVLDLRAAAETVRELKPRFEESPVLLPVRLWQAAKREILGNPSIRRFVLDEGQGEWVIWLNPDPEQQREEIRQRLEGKKPPG
jgi:membrane protease subunit HflK